jgi:hypothetical protein
VSGAEAICEESAPFVGEGASPDFCFGAFEKICERALFSSCEGCSGKIGDMMSIPLADGCLD